MYEDVSTDSVSTSYAVQGSGRSVGYDEMSNIVSSSTLRKIGMIYWLPRAYPSYNCVCDVLAGGDIDRGADYDHGIRPVVTLKSTCFVYANEGDDTHTTLETAWNLN